MKRYKYRWKFQGKEITGEKECLNEEVLKNHIEQHGGKLLEIVSEEKLPDVPLPVPDDHFVTVKVPVGIPESKVLIRLSPLPEWLNRLWGWSAVLTGSLMGLLALIMILISLFAGLEWMGPYPFWIKIFSLSAAVLLSFLQIFLGKIILRFPLAAAHVLFSCAAVAIAFELADLLRGDKSALLPSFLLAALLVFLIKKR